MDKKSMSKTMPKPAKRYLYEFLLIFFSIVAAFYFEDYREDRREKNQYRELLIDFRVDLLKNFRDMFYETDSLRLMDSHRGFSYINLKHSQKVLELLLDQKATMQDIKNYYRGYPYGSFGPVSNWIHESTISQELINKYSEFVPTRLKNLLVRYRWAMYGLSENVQKQNESFERLNEIFELSDPFQKYSSGDSLLFYSNEFRNKFKTYVNHLEDRMFIRDIVSGDGWFVMLLKTVDMELKELEVDPNSLEDQPNFTIIKRLENDIGRPIDGKADSLLNLNDLVRHRMNITD